jgi:hypothetical protein
MLRKTQPPSCEAGEEKGERLTRLPDMGWVLSLRLLYFIPPREVCILAVHFRLFIQG